MKIVIEMHSLREAHRIMYDIYEEYGNKIKNIKKTRGEIALINGDYIKFISNNGKTNDGSRADVAIGPSADILTFASSHEKRVWDLKDLYNHIKTI